MKDYKQENQVMEDRSETVSNGIPIGTIVAYFGEESQIPKNWLLCDGRPVQEEYPKLQQHLMALNRTSATPNLRGMFLRGSDLTSRGRQDKNDPDFELRSGQGQKIGSVQSDAIQKHSHSYAYASPAQHTKESGTDPMSLTQPGGNTTTGETGGSETRPKNVYVNYIIKAR